MHRSMTLKQRITLGLAAFLLALAVQIFLSFYQSGTVMQRLDDQMGQFNAISRFQGGVERGLTVLGDYRWEYGDADALLSGLDSAFSTTDAWLWRIDGSLETVSEEEYLLYSAVCTTYKSYTALVKQLEAAVRTGDDAGAARLYYDQVLPCGSYLRQYTQQLLNTAISDAQGTYTEVSALSGRVKWAQTVVATVCLVLGCFMAWSVIRLLDPVQQMIGASRDIVAGKYDTPDVPIPGGGREIVQLTDAFNKMKHSMAQQMNTLQERHDCDHYAETERVESAGTRLKRLSLFFSGKRTETSVLFFCRCGILFSEEREMEETHHEKQADPARRPDCRCRRRRDGPACQGSRGRSSGTSDCAGS